MESGCDHKVRYSNFHTHSTFSDGANTVEELVLAAIELGFVSLGISDHSHTPFDLRYCMRPVVFPAYLREVRRVAEKYKDRIQVYTGLEWDGYSELENREEYDYLIGSTHYIKAGGRFHSVDHAKDEQWETIENYFSGDTMAYARTYYETYVACQKKNRPDIMGHFDVLIQHGQIDEENPEYRSMATEALIASLEVTPIIEVNNAAIAKKRRTQPFPHSFLLKEALAHGAKVMLSSDAHRAENLNFHFDESVQLLKSLGYNEVVVFKDHQFQEVGI